MQISFDVDRRSINRIKKAMETVGKGNIEGQIAQAINRATTKTVSATSAPVGASQVIREKMNVKAKKVKDVLDKFPRANKNRLKSGFSIEKTHRISLINFSARQKKSGVSYLVEKGGGRKTIPGAFIAPVGRKKAEDDRPLHVFKRKTRSSRYDGRLPLLKLSGVSIFEFVKRNRMEKRIRKNGRIRLRAELIDQRKRIIQRWGKK